MKLKYGVSIVWLVEIIASLETLYLNGIQAMSDFLLYMVIPINSFIAIAFVYKWRKKKRTITIKEVK